ncbi:MAG: TonB-dependent receptor [Halioglobus sp.]
MKALKRTLSTSLLGVVALALPSEIVAAQGSLALEEVIVTATKRASSLQDVAVAVSALSADMIADNQIIQTADIANLVPSLTVQQGSEPSNSSFNVRGLGTQSFSEGVEPSVATLVDGVVLGRSAMAFGQLPDIERVEVLRGPQGTLFGKNASAGVINFISKRPTESLEADVSLMAIEDGEYRVAGTISGPISSNLAYRLTGSYIDADGWIENVYDGKDYNGHEDKLAKAKLLWTPTDSLEIGYTVDWAESDCKCTVSTAREAEEPSATRLLPVVASEDNNTLNTSTSQTPLSENESIGHAIHIDWQIGDYTVTSISAWRSWDFISSTGLGLLPEDPLGFATTREKEQEQFTQELRLNSPADQYISYVAGLFYFDQTIDSQTNQILELINRDIDSDITVDTANYAAFGEAVVNMSERWRLTIGGRYTNDEIDYKFKRTGSADAIDPAVSDGTDEDDLSGKLALQWDVNNSTMTYVSYAQGYKGPAYSLVQSTDVENLEPIEPESSDAWEWGIKSSLFDNSMSVNLAIFYTDFENFQAEAFVPGATDEEPGNFETTNAGEVSTEGVELDLSWRATENLTIYGGVAYINAEIDDYPDGACSFGQQAEGDPGSCANPPLGTGTQDLSGGDLPHSPDWRLTLNANYLLPLTSMPFDLIFKGNYRWQDEVLFDLSQDEGTIQDSYEILDLAVELRDRDDHYSVVVFVKNAADQDYVTSIRSNNVISFPGGGYAQTVPRLAERTLGLELRYNWF